MRALPERILDVDIVQFEVTGPDPQSGRGIVVRLRFLAFRRDDGHLIRGVRCVVFRVPINGQGTIELGDVDLLLVGARMNEDGLLRGGSE